MSQSANAKSVYQPNSWEMMHLSAAELQRRRLEGPPRQHVPAEIDFASIPAASQLALISISGHGGCRAVTEEMRKSTARFNVHDFDILRDLNLATRERGKPWHSLTNDGRHYAPIVARKIAQEIGLHATWAVGGLHYHTVYCTCSWSTRLYSSKRDAMHDHSDRIARHLAEAAQATRPTSLTTEANYGSTSRA